MGFPIRIVLTFLVVLPACADQRYEALLASRRVTPPDDMPPAEVLALVDFIRSADDGCYAKLWLSIGSDREKGYSVIATNSPGTSSGYWLEIENGAAGLRLVSRPGRPASTSTERRSVG